MGKYDGEFKGVEYDELQAGGDFPILTNNVEVTAAVLRGDLIASGADGRYHKAKASDAAGAQLAIARDSGSKIVPAYVAGRFHREKIMTSNSETAPVKIFEKALREQNIYLTGLGQ